MPPIEEEHTDIVYARVDSVVVRILENQELLQSKRNKELNEWIMKEFKVALRTAQKYSSLAKKEVRRIGKAKKEKAYEKAIQDREYIIRRFKEKDPKLALDAMKDRDKLCGLYIEQSKEDITVSLKDVNLNSLTDEQLVKLKEMLKKGIEVRDALLHIGVIIK